MRRYFIFILLILEWNSISAAKLPLRRSVTKPNGKSTDNGSIKYHLRNGTLEKLIDIEEGRCCTASLTLNLSSNLNESSELILAKLKQFEGQLSGSERFQLILNATLPENSSQRYATDIVLTVDEFLRKSLPTTTTSSVEVAMNKTDDGFCSNIQITINTKSVLNITQFLEVDLSRPGMNIRQAILTTLITVLKSPTILKKTDMRIILNAKPPVETGLLAMKKITYAVESVLKKLTNNSDISITISGKQNDDGFFTSITYEINRGSETEEENNLQEMSALLKDFDEQLLTYMSRINNVYHPGEVIAFNFETELPVGASSVLIDYMVKYIRNSISQFLSDKNSALQIHILRKIYKNNIKLKIILSIPALKKSQDDKIFIRLDLSKTSVQAYWIEEVKHILVNLRDKINKRVITDSSIELKFIITPPKASNQILIKDVASMLLISIAEIYTNMEIKRLANDEIDSQEYAIQDFTIQPKSLIKINLILPGSDLLEEINKILPYLEEVLQKNKFSGEPVYIHLRIQVPESSTEQFRQNITETLVSILSDHSPTYFVSANGETNRNSKDNSLSMLTVLTFKPKQYSYVFSLHLADLGSDLTERMSNILMNLTSELNENQRTDQLNVNVLLNVYPPEKTPDTFVSDTRNYILHRITQVFPHNNIALNAKEERDSTGTLVMIIIYFSIQSKTSAVDLITTKNPIEESDFLITINKNIIKRLSNTLRGIKYNVDRAELNGEILKFGVNIELSLTSTKESIDHTIEIVLASLFSIFETNTVGVEQKINKNYEKNKTIIILIFIIDHKEYSTTSLPTSLDVSDNPELSSTTSGLYGYIFSTLPSQETSESTNIPPISTPDIIETTQQQNEEKPEEISSGLIPSVVTETSDDFSTLPSDEISISSNIPPISTTILPTPDIIETTQQQNEDNSEEISTPGLTPPVVIETSDNFSTLTSDELSISTNIPPISTILPTPDIVETAQQQKEENPEEGSTPGVIPPAVTETSDDLSILPSDETSISKNNPPISTTILPTPGIVETTQQQNEENREEGSTPGLIPPVVTETSDDFTTLPSDETSISTRIPPISTTILPTSDIVETTQTQNEENQEEGFTQGIIPPVVTEASVDFSTLPSDQTSISTNIPPIISTILPTPDIVEPTQQQDENNAREGSTPGFTLPAVTETSAEFSTLPSHETSISTDIPPISTSILPTHDIVETTQQQNQENLEEGSTPGLVPPVYAGTSDDFSTLPSDETSISTNIPRISTTILPTPDIVATTQQQNEENPGEGSTPGLYATVVTKTSNDWGDFSTLPSDEISKSTNIPPISTILSTSEIVETTQQQNEEKPEEISTPGLIPPVVTETSDDLGDFSTLPSDETSISTSIPPISTTILPTPGLVETTQQQNEENLEEGSTPRLIPTVVTATGDDDFSTLPSDETSISIDITPISTTISPTPNIVETTQQQNEENPEEGSTQGLLPPVVSETSDDFGTSPSDETSISTSIPPIRTTILPTPDVVETTQQQNEENPEEGSTPGLIPPVVTETSNEWGEFHTLPSDETSISTNIPLISTTILPNPDIVETTQQQNEENPEEASTPGLNPPVVTETSDDWSNFSTSSDETSISTNIPPISTTILPTHDIVETNQQQNEENPEEGSTPGLIPPVVTETNDDWSNFSTSSDKTSISTNIPPISTTILPTPDNVETTQQQNEEHPEEGSTPGLIPPVVTEISDDFSTLRSDETTISTNIPPISSTILATPDIVETTQQQNENNPEEGSTPGLIPPVVTETNDDFSTLASDEISISTNIPTISTILPTHDIVETTQQQNEDNPEEGSTPGLIPFVVTETSDDWSNFSTSSDEISISTNIPPISTTILPTPDNAETTQQQNEENPEEGSTPGLIPPVVTETSDDWSNFGTSSDETSISTNIPPISTTILPTPDNAETTQQQNEEHPEEGSKPGLISPVVTEISDDFSTLRSDETSISTNIPPISTTLLATPDIVETTQQQNAENPEEGSTPGLIPPVVTETNDVFSTLASDETSISTNILPISTTILPTHDILETTQQQTEENPEEGSTPGLIPPVVTETSDDWSNFSTSNETSISTNIPPISTTILPTPANAETPQQQNEEHPEESSTPGLTAPVVTEVSDDSSTLPSDETSISTKIPPISTIILATPDIVETTQQQIEENPVEGSTPGLIAPVVTEVSDDSSTLPSDETSISTKIPPISTTILATPDIVETTQQQIEENPEEGSTPGLIPPVVTETSDDWSNFSTSNETSISTNIPPISTTILPTPDNAETPQQQNEEHPEESSTPGLIAPVVTEVSDDSSTIPSDETSISTKIPQISTTILATPDIVETTQQQIEENPEEGSTPGLIPPVVTETNDDFSTLASDETSISTNIPPISTILPTLDIVETTQQQNQEKPKEGSTPGAILHVVTETSDDWGDFSALPSDETSISINTPPTITIIPDTEQTESAEGTTARVTYLVVSQYCVSINISLIRNELIPSIELENVLASLPSAVNTNLIKGMIVNLNFIIVPPEGSKKDFLQEITKLLVNKLPKLFLTNEVVIRSNYELDIQGYLKNIILTVKIEPISKKPAYILDLSEAEIISLEVTINKTLSNVVDDIRNELNNNSAAVVPSIIKVPKNSTRDYLLLISDSLLLILRWYLPTSNINVEMKSSPNSMEHVSDIYTVITIESFAQKSPIKVDMDLSIVGLDLNGYIRQVLAKVMHDASSDLNNGLSAKLQSNIIPPAKSTQDFLKAVTNKLVSFLEQHFIRNNINAMMNYTKNAHGYLNHIFIETIIEPSTENDNINKTIDIDLSDPEVNLNEHINKILSTVIPNIKNYLKNTSLLSLHFSIRPPAKSNEDYVQVILESLELHLRKFFPTNKRIVEWKSHQMDTYGYLSIIRLEIFIESFFQREVTDILLGNEINIKSHDYKY